MMALALGAGVATASAGGYLTNTNQHVAFLRNPARNASTGIEAIYSNPAGLAFLPEGWYFSANVQSAMQTRTIRSTFAPFALNADGKSSLAGERSFEGKAFAPIIPSLSAAYKTGDWTFGGHFAIVGGGGKASFDGGLPSFEMPVSLIPSLLSQALGAPVTRYQYETAMQGSQYIFGLTLGAAYKVNDNLSAYLGVRGNLANGHYEGYVRNIRAQVGGNMIPVSATLSARAQAAQAAGLAPQANLLSAYARATADKELNVDQSGLGITPIVGVHYRIGQLDLAARYEHTTKLTLKNKTTTNTTGVTSYDDAQEVASDIPALLSLGASYSILPSLKISAGYHHYFDKQARMSGNRQLTLKHGTHEYLAGVEYDLSDRLTLSLGGQLTNYGLSDQFQQDMTFSCDSYSVGLGGAYRLSDKVRLQLAYLFTNYSDYTKSSTYQAAATLQIPVKDIYSRTNHVLGLGVDFTL